MEKLREWIVKWLDGQKVKGISVSLYDIKCIVIVYNDIVTGKKPEFINGKVKEILDKCGIQTEVKGIGWIVK